METSSPPIDGMIYSGNEAPTTHSESASYHDLDDNGKATTEASALPAPDPPPRPSSVWFCQSRWLMAHHDPMANISTFKSHLCFVDMNHDGDYNLALIDIRCQPTTTSETVNNNRQQHEPPYMCTLKVFRGKKQVYSYRLADLPSSLNVTAESVRRIDYNLDESILSMTQNCDIRIFHHLKSWRLLSLTDEHWKSSANQSRH